MLLISNKKHKNVIRKIKLKKNKLFLKNHLIISKILVLLFTRMKNMRLGGVA